MIDNFVRPPVFFAGLYKKMKLSINKKENMLRNIYVDDKPADLILKKLQKFEEETEVGECVRLEMLGQGSYGVVTKCNVQLNGTMSEAALKEPKKRGKEPPYDFFREAYYLTVMMERQKSFRPAERLVQLLGLKLDFSDVLKSSMILNYAGDTNLKKWVEKMQLVSLPQIRDLSCQILTAVEELRSRRILHRDIKMENFVVDRTNHLTLCDFGMATDWAKTHALTGIEFGTPSTMPPERILGIGHYEYAYDVWSAACVIYSIITGGNLMVPNSGTTSMTGRPNRKEYFLKNLLYILGSKIPRPRKNMLSTGWRDLHRFLSNVEPKARNFDKQFGVGCKDAISKGKLVIHNWKDCMKFGEDLSKLAHWYGPSRVVISRKRPWRHEIRHVIPTSVEQEDEIKKDQSVQNVDKWQVYPINSIGVEKLPSKMKLTGQLSKKGRKKKRNILRGMEKKEAFQANREVRKKYSRENKKKRLR